MGWTLSGSPGVCFARNGAIMGVGLAVSAAVEPHRWVAGVRSF